MDDSVPKFLSDELKNLMAPPQVEAPKIVETPTTDFLAQGVEFWSKKGRAYVSAFEKGEMISNYNSVSQYDHLSFFLGLCRVLEEVVRDELLKKEIEFTDTKEVFKILESSFKLLSKNIEIKLSDLSRSKKEIQANTIAQTYIDINQIFAIMHGFITSYVQKHRTT